MGLLLLRAPAEHRRVIDDHPGTAWLHMRQHRAGHPESAGEGDIQHLRPLLIGHLDHTLLPAQACVIDQHIDPAQRTFGAGHQGLDLLLTGHIAQLAIDRLQTGFGLQPFHGFLQAARMHIRNHQCPTALFGTAPSGGITDTGAGGGSDQHRLAGQQLVTGHIRGSLIHSGNLQGLYTQTGIKPWPGGNIVKTGYGGLAVGAGLPRDGS
ncbi:hypothetical protein D3C77_466300 [compost metagenome]